MSVLASTKRCLNSDFAVILAILMAQRPLARHSAMKRNKSCMNLSYLDFKPFLGNYLIPGSGNPHVARGLLPAADLLIDHCSVLLL
jgi:hypothetical protein